MPPVALNGTTAFVNNNNNNNNAAAAATSSSPSGRSLPNGIPSSTENYNSYHNNNSNSPGFPAVRLGQRKRSIPSPNARIALMEESTPQTPRANGECEDDSHSNSFWSSSSSGHSSSFLSARARYAYGIGHVLNDLCASFWFSYLLVFLRHVLLFPGKYAGLLMLIGQLADAIATPVSGALSDLTTRKRAQGILREREAEKAELNGKDSSSNGTSHQHHASHSAWTRALLGRKAWVGGGSLVLALSIPPVFHYDIFNLQIDNYAGRAAYYSFFIILLQFAWACVQVSHLALVPELTPEPCERVYLNSLRSCFTILSSIVVYVMAYYFIQTGDGQKKQQSDSSNCSTNPMASNQLCPADEPTFFYLSLFIVALGGLAVTLFLLGVSEPEPRVKRESHVHMHWHMWFQRLQFYQIAIIYMCTRLLVNVSQTYVPLFLLVTLSAAKTSIATIPLTIFGVGFISTLLSEKLTTKFGSAGLTLLGCGAVVGGCALVWLSTAFNSTTFFFAALLGVGSGVVGVSALGLICDLVGENTESSAFVYGSMSFVDKLANGLAIFIAECLTPPTGDDEQMKTLQSFYRHVMTFVPGGSAVLCIVMLLFLQSTKRRARYEQLPTVDEGEAEGEGRQWQKLDDGEAV